jgi:hypothetical protein
MYRVHIGYTRNGNDRWRYFDSLDVAVAFCGSVFRRSGLVLSITEAA